MDRLATMDAFIRVVDAGSFSGAASQLRMGQSAVSKAIAQLEERIRVRLLLRSTHGLTPTEAGRIFYERAKRSVEEADGAELAARGAAATLSGRLRVQATVAFGRLHIIPRLPAFLAQHPALDVDIVLDDRNINLVEAGIDIGLRVGQLVNSALTARKIAQCERRVIGTPSYFKAAGVPRGKSYPGGLTSGAMKRILMEKGSRVIGADSPMRKAESNPRSVFDRACSPTSASPSHLNGCLRRS